MQVRIPIDDVEAREVADVATMSGWALAGYVASQVTLGEKHIHTSRDARTSITPSEFAAKGIRGLRSKDTVRLYAERWRGADPPLPNPVPGESVDVGDRHWPPAEAGFERTGAPEDKERGQAIRKQAREDGMPSGALAVTIASNPKAMAAAIKADPATAEAAATALYEAELVNEGDGDALDDYSPDDPNHGELARQMERERREREARERERHGSVVLVLNVLAEMLAAGRRELAKVEGRTFAWDTESRAALADLAAKVHVLEVRVAAMPDSEPLTSEAIYEGLGMH